MSEPGAYPVALETDAVNAADEWATAAAEQLGDVHGEAATAQAQATLALAHEVRALRLAFAEPLNAVADMLARSADALDRLA